MRARWSLAIGMGVLLAALVLGPMGQAAAPVKTMEPPGAVGLAPGVMYDPILTAGDIVGNYQMTGVPDGGGFWFKGWGHGGLTWVFDHELADKKQYPDPALGALDNFGSRVSVLTLNHNGAVTSAKHIVRGTESYVWFCSGNLTVLDGKPWYFTGEEGTYGSHGGTSIAVDVQQGTFKDLPWFGFFAHEQEIPVPGLGRATVMLSEDGPKSKSQMYQYTARSWNGVLNGNGRLGVFVPFGDATDGNWSTNDIVKGETLQGRFVRLDQLTDNANEATLEAAAQAAGAFDFVRAEDVATSKNNKRVTYISDTGSLGHETVRGRVYKMTLNAENPHRASLTVLLDGDAGDNIVNPDNLDTSTRSLMIQEDRNSEHRHNADMGPQTGYSRVLAYNLATGTLTVVARVDTPPALAALSGEGVWETSGIVDASSVWGPGWWLMTVQQHETSKPQAANPSLIPNTTTGEAGQVGRLFVPGS
jgi:hypothetical protein